MYSLIEAERLVEEVKNARDQGDDDGGPAFAKVLVRLLIGVGSALPNCNRAEDAVAVLNDACTIAHSR